MGEASEGQLKWWDDMMAEIEAQAYQVSEDRSIQRHYVRMRLNGQSHKLAEMLATRSFPGINGTDKAFNRGRCNGNQFEGDPELGDHFRRIADQQGVSTTGKYYCYGLGRYPGDPRAWISSAGEAVAIAKERNLNLDGIVNYKSPEVEPAPDIPLAEDLWERDAQELVQTQEMKYEDAREKVFNLRTGREVIQSAPDPGPMGPPEFLEEWGV